MAAADAGFAQTDTQRITPKRLNFDSVQFHIAEFNRILQKEKSLDREAYCKQLDSISDNFKELSSELKKRNALKEEELKLRQEQFKYQCKMAELDALSPDMDFKYISREIRRIVKKYS